MRITSKINLGIGSVALLLIIICIVGLMGTNRLNETLSSINGSARTAIDSSLESTLALQQQLRITLSLLNARSPENAIIQQAREHNKLTSQILNRSIQQIADSQLLSNPQRDELQQSATAYQTQQNQLLKQHQSFVEAYQESRTNMAQLLEITAYAEEVGDRVVESLQSNPNLAMSWQGGLEDKWEAADGIMETHIHTLSHIYYFQQLLERGNNPRWVQALESSRDKLERAIARLSYSPSFQHAEIPQGELANQRFQDVLPELASKHQALTTLVLQHHDKLKQLAKRLEQQNSTLINTLDEITQIASHNLHRQLTEAETMIDTLDLSIIIATVIGLLISITAVYHIQRGIGRSLQQTIDDIHKITSNEGELTDQLTIHGNDDVAKLGHAFNGYVSKIDSTLQQIAQSTAQLTTQSETLTEIANHNLNATSNQLTEIEQVATTIAELSQTSETVASHSNQVAKANAQASEQAQQGQSAINDMVQRITQLNQGMGHTAEVISHLEQDAAAIEKILDVMRGIAEQTNLLALNAAIEAARAGDQGRGFAVVADEVRDLATRSQASSEEVNTLIERLRGDSQKAVEAMAHSQQQAELTIEQTEQVNASFNAISDAVNTANDLAAQIASSALQQSSASEEVARNLINIKDLSTHNSKGSVSASDTSQELNELAQQLKVQLGRFRR